MWQSPKAGSEVFLPPGEDASSGAEQSWETEMKVASHWVCEAYVPVKECFLLTKANGINNEHVTSSLNLDS